MQSNRTYSTRELAQMWNVSESTIKRWADAGELCCYRTPGGHRKFHLKDISDFQRRRSFEATGLLLSEKWEDPDIEEALNRKAFGKIHELLHYLALQNQRFRIRKLLERLYLRGVGLVELYDEILLPVLDEGRRMLESGKLTLGQERLLRNNLDEGIALLFPQLIRKRQNGRTGLCAAPDGECQVLVNAVARVLEMEGWDCLNLGASVPFSAMAEMVEAEPVNLVCVASASPSATLPEDYAALAETAENYRIPLLLTGSSFADPELRETIPHDIFLADFRTFREYLQSTRD